MIYRKNPQGWMFSIRGKEVLLIQRIDLQRDVSFLSLVGASKGTPVDFFTQRSMSLTMRQAKFHMKKVTFNYISISVLG